MDKTALVTGDREAEGLVVAALSLAKIPAIAVEWDWSDDAEEWRLTVVSSPVRYERPTRVLFSDS
jgi:hypothetical protein